MNCTECKSAIWDYEEYYGTSERQYFVCGCKEDKDPELCANYKGMCGSCHYWDGESCMNFDSPFAADYMDAEDSCSRYSEKRG